MRKQVFGRQFKRDANERKALFRGLVNALVLHERIQTTEQKAKAIRPLAEKLVTKAKKGGPQARMQLQPHLSVPAMNKMVTEIAPRFADRNGGYTRIYRIGNRLADNAMMAQIEWVVTNSEFRTQNAESAKPSRRTGEATEKVEATAATKTAKKAPAKKETTKPAAKGKAKAKGAAKKEKTK